jgi:dihydroorotase
MTRHDRNQDSRLLIRGGRVIDPANGLDTIADVYIQGSRIAAIGEAPEGFGPSPVIDASGQVVCPGLVDLAARLREPGQEHKATIESEARAAAAGGITTLCLPPDTDPVMDTPAVVELVRRRAKHARHTWVLPIGAFTQGLEGKQLCELAALQEEGCVAVSNGLRPMANTLVLRRAMEYAATFRLRVHLHAQDPWLADGGCVHEGAVATRMGLPGIPEAAETADIARILALVEHTGVHLHFCRLSSARGAEMVARARADGLPVSADVSAHQLHLTEMDITGFDSQCHLQPPLRTQRDRDGLRQAVADGHISAICSDHQPHEADAKTAPFPSTEPGISSLETLLPLTLRLVDEGVLDLPQAVARLTSGPAEILDLPLGSLRPGNRADVCVFDPQAHWRLTEDNLLSRGLNTPFLGWEFRGRVTHTVLEGRVVHGQVSGEE